MASGPGVSWEFIYGTGPVLNWTPLPYWTPVLYWSSIAIVFMIANPVILTPRYISFSYDAITARGQVTSLDVIFFPEICSSRSISNSHFSVISIIGQSMVA